jgi:hypothetical protein
MQRGDAVGNRICVMSFVLLLLSVSAGADVCEWAIVADYSVIAGGVEWRHVEYGLVCYTTVYAGGGKPPAGGATVPIEPPPPPSVRVVSASDENPHDVELRFEYSGAPTSMTLRKNGVIVASGAPSTSGRYGSLDNMVFDSVLSVTMCNAGGCADDFAEVRRSTRRPRAEGAVSAQWAETVPDPWEIQIVTGYESYTRILEAELFYAEYTVPTAGARNGRVQHVQSTDALLWENGKRVPVWTTYYGVVPAWGYMPVMEQAFETPGCQLAQSRFPNSSSRCTVRGEFGRDGSPGTGWIESVIANSSLGDPQFAFGALELEVYP